MPVSYRIRPNGQESKLEVVVSASFTNPATDIPDSAVAIVFGDNVPLYSLQSYERAKDLMNRLIEAPVSITASQYGKLTIGFSKQGQIAIADVAGTDTPDADELTLYVGSAVLQTKTAYLKAAYDYLYETALERTKAA